MLTKTINELFRLLDFDTTIITPNRRLSATLHKLYQQYQIAEQQTHWLTPDILPAASWYQRLYLHLTQTQTIAAALLLTPAQEQFLWKNILDATPEVSHFLQPVETAAMVKSAWSLSKQWLIDREDALFQTSEDYSAFQHWAAAFEQTCREQGWIDNASLPGVIMQQIKANKIKLPKQLILLGFTEITPELNLLLQYCRDANVFVQHIELSHHHELSQRLSLVDEEEELLTMARWAKSLLAKHPDSNIACVLPGLETRRDRVAQVFSAVFAPQGTHAINPQAAPFNISAGKSLIFYPIIHAALQILSLYKKSITSETLSYLLSSPFLGESESEYTKRSALDSLLRQKNINRLKLNDVLQQSDNLITTTCPQFAARLRHFFQLLKSTTTKQTHYTWSHLFTQMLTAMGWPGERSLVSEEYQVVEQWLLLLDQLNTLDYLNSAVDYHSALQNLEELAAKTVFQPKTPDARIQVLGVLEAAALPFDYLWIAGLDDLTWPPQPNPNPFIPRSLQRELHMPHATAERELSFCQSLIRQFQQSAKHIIFSHALKKDEIELEVSPLIRHLPVISLDALELTDYILPSTHIYQTKELEKIYDEQAPALMLTEKIYGGVDILKQQAMCPFKAFSSWRLHARELETTLPGLRPSERGKLVHKVLEIIWSALQDQSRLLALSNESLQDLLITSIDHAFLLMQLDMRSQYLKLEKQRLYQLVWDWLQHEKQRPAFTVVMNEKNMTLPLNQLQLNVRIDRVDELADGKKLVIDYKTGKYNQIQDWFGERPNEPQLPLYALLDPTSTIGMAFAQVTTGSVCFKGISQYSLDIQGIKKISDTSWPDQINQWQTTLTQLSDDFCAGIAKTDPKEGKKTCEHCALHSFCRISEENYADSPLI